MLSGDNGILQKATDAKIKTERTDAKEQVQLDILAWQSDKISKGQSSELNDEVVQGILTGKSYVKTADVASFTTAKGGYEIPYSELYTSSNKTPPSAGQKLKDIITSADYGKSIDYSVTVSGKTLNNWKVFFNDNNNVYIILGDYLEASLIPSGTGLNTDTASYKYCVWGDTNRDKLINGLKSNSWNVFATGIEEITGISGATAAGSPDLEMWVKSWNEKHGDSSSNSNKQELYTGYTDNDLDSCAAGYYIVKEPMKTAYIDYDEGYSGYYVDISNTTGYGDTLYFPPQGDVDHCFAYWLSSPSANHSETIMLVNAEGWVRWDNALDEGNHYIGARPIICLPSEIIGTVGDSVTIDK